jgi:hypothetical protein
MSSDSGTHDLTLWLAEPMTSGRGLRLGEPVLAPAGAYAPAGRTSPDS